MKKQLMVFLVSCSSCWAQVSVPGSSDLDSGALEPNIARPDRHPYSDPAQGREGYLLADQAVNEFRLYDFYSRQADYYLETQTVPEVIPAYPGMEAGIFGHWGKYSQFHLRNDRWSRMNFGTVVGGVIRPSGRILPKAVVVSLGDGLLSACFDPQTFSYQAAWSKGFVRLGTSRWGMMSNLGVAGEIEWLSPEGQGWARVGNGGAVEGEYLGYYRYGNEVVFHYKLGPTEVLDLPSAQRFEGRSVFGRTMRFDGGFDASLRLLNVTDGWELAPEDRALETPYLRYQGPKGSIIVAVKSDTDANRASIELNSGEPPSLRVNATGEALLVKVYIASGVEDLDSFLDFVAEDTIEDPKAKTMGGDRLWPETFVLPGSISERQGPYVVDSLPVPLDNPYRSMMFLSGLSFFENGDAAVATFFGDVWLVSGIDQGLGSVRWKRFATGLNQPLGVEIVDGKIYVLGKDQITILHDLNGDQEADYYENFCNRFVTSPGGHDYNTGLQRDAQGYFYFATKHAGIYRISPDGERANIIATGLRNPNGIGVSPGGRVVTSPQQGQWAPASMIIEANEGEFYGYPKDRVDQPIAPPLCFIPRGVDNSTGGQLFVSSDRWGPFKEQLLSFSFGDCSHQLVLRDDDEGRAQGAIVALSGEFESGAHRGRFHPVDGQLYVVGSQGWGNYAFKDGSFQRVRYTGAPVYYPVGFKVHYNGLRIDFPRELSREGFDARRDVFCQQWNYQYSKGYGSPEFSIRHPERFGHDALQVKSVHVLEDAKSLFLEIPDLSPAMQVHVRMHLKFKDGKDIDTDLYATILRLGSPLEGFSAPATLVPNKPMKLSLRVLELPELAPAKDNDAEPGRPIVIKAVTGLKYDQSFIKVRAGERLSLTLENTDVMPHNWVLVGFEGYTRVGEASVRMLNDPLAFQKGFVPNSRDVIVHTSVVNPNEKETIHFNAPTAAGEYPFLCTYPGHWQLMRGTLIVY